MESYIHEREVYKKLTYKNIPYWVLNELGDDHYVVIYANNEPQTPFLLFIRTYIDIVIETFPEGILVETLFIPKFKKKEGRVTDHIYLRLVKTYGFLYVGNKEYLLFKKWHLDTNIQTGSQLFIGTPNHPVASGKDNEGEIIWAYGSPREIMVKGDYILDRARTKPALTRFYENTDKFLLDFVEE